MKGITVLGSTGSIGVNTLDVISRHADKYKIKALTANTNDDLIREQCIKHQPEFAVMVDEDSALRLEQKLKDQAPDVTVLSGVDGLLRVATEFALNYVGVWPWRMGFTRAKVSSFLGYTFFLPPPVCYRSYFFA